MQIIIPMSGFGERFRVKGYNTPKPLIMVNGKPIISYVIDMFPGEKDFIFICNEDHLKNLNYKMAKILKKFCPTGKIISIAPHKKGPVHAVIKAKKAINFNKPIIVNYCDFTCYWSWKKFKHFVLKKNCSGAIPAYKGFHPHSLGKTNYAYILEKRGIASDIQEKKPFTSNKLDEYASSGTYYFKNAKIMFDSFDYIKKNRINVKGEQYVSLAYKYFFNQKKNERIYIYPLKHFMQWGTPEDLEEYINWSNIFNKITKLKNQYTNNNGTLIVPMAGEGQRFVNEGYKKIKPLIEVSGKPMVIQAVNSLLNFKNKIFVIRSNMKGIKTISKKLKQSYSNIYLKTLRNKTQGQADTALNAIKQTDPNTNININENITISACDNGVIFNSKKLNNYMNDTKKDIIVWGIRGHPHAIRNPEMYGWINLNKKSNKIISVSVKSPLQNTTLDPIIIGTFTFRNKFIARSSIETLIEKNNRINNEFYIDSSINEAIKLGFKCYYFEIDYYLSWGTPNDLKTFEYWQSCFHKWRHHNYNLYRDKNIPKDKINILEKKYNSF